MIRCFNCGHKLDGPFHRSSECPQCGRSVRVCLNCRFYLPGAHWDCRETIEAFVPNKEKANFCDCFQAGENPHEPGNRQNMEREEKSRQDFRKLFGDA